MKNKKHVEKQLEDISPKSSLGLILAIITGIIGVIIYLNTVGNEYVLDDNNAITKNLFVQQGISGIPKLLTIDFWYFENMKLGYYRPLSLITFAIEHELFGDKPAVGHFDNALLYGLSGFILCLLLIKLFKGKNPAFAFLISFIFMAHPIHTEVVANIKSRDEILSFLNMIAMIYFAFRYVNTKKRKDIVWSIVFFYLALLSKETAVLGIALLPLFLYYSGIKIPDILKKLVPYIAVALLFFIQKRYFLGPNSVQIPDDIVNYPYTRPNIKLPTVFHIFSLCLKLLILPWPLSHDYSYNEIPASHWSDIGAWIGFILFAGLAIIGIRGLIKKTILGLGLSVVFITIVPSLAFVFLRGGIMAERFLYAPTLGFAIIVVYLLSLLSTKQKETKVNLVAWLKNNMVLTGVVVLLCLVYSVETIGRNTAWKDQITLFGTDAKHTPNSAHVHLNYGLSLHILARLEKDSVKKRQGFDAGLKEMQKAVEIDPQFGDAIFEIGAGYQLVEINLDSAIKYYKIGMDLTPSNAVMSNNLGVAYQTIGKLKLASYYYNMAAEANPQFPDGPKNAADLKKSTGLDVHVYPGDDAMTTQKPTEQKVVTEIPPDEKGKDYNYYNSQGSAAISNGNVTLAITYFKKAASLKPKDLQTLLYLGNSYGMAKRYPEAVYTFQQILQIDPDYQSAIKNLVITYDDMGDKAKGDEMRKKLK